MLRLVRAIPLSLLVASLGIVPAVAQSQRSEPSKSPQVRALDAQRLAASMCREGDAGHVAATLAKRFLVSELRLTKGLQKLNSLQQSQKQWCDLTIEELQDILDNAMAPKVDLSESREEWMRFTMGDEQGRIPPGGLSRALEQRRALVRKESRPGAPVPTDANLSALPPSLAGWTNLVGYKHPVGRINDLLIHPTSPSTMWAGADGGGIWKTTDGGTTWQAANDFMGSLSVAAFAMRPGDPSIIYAATGAQGSHTGAGGDGVFKSTDGGSTWSQLAATDPATNADFYYTYDLAIDPSNSGIVLAATNGGAYLTTDGGTIWTKIAAASTCARNVAIHPSNGNLRVIAMDDGTVRVATDGSTYNTYTIAAVAAPSYTRLALAPSDQNVMYALVNNSGTTQIYRSSTGGTSWVEVPMTAANIFYNSYYLSYTGGIWIDPTNANHVAVVEGWAAVTSDAAAVSPVWTRLKGGWVDFHGVVSDPGYNGTTNRIIYFVDDGGLYRWDDADTVGTVLPAYLATNGINVTQAYAVSGRSGGNEMFGAQDVASRVYRTDPLNGDLTEKWRRPAGLGGHDGAAAAVDRTNPSIMYGSTQRLSIHRSLDGGANAEFICQGITDITCGTATGSAAFIAPLVLDPNAQNRMLAGAASLWRSNDVSTGTPPAWSAIHTGVGSNVCAIAIAPTDSNVIWVAYQNRSVYKTVNGTDAAPTWTQISNVPAGNKLRIYIDRTDANRVYIGLSGFLANRLVMTPDGGATWSAAPGLPSASVFAIQQHPSIPNWFYVGTAVGLFASDDGGATWSTTNEGPANVQVRDLAWYSESGASAELLVGTFGRGIWRATLNAAASPGAIRFGSAAFTATEDAAGGATVTFVRADGGAGAVSVSYATADGMATAPADFTSSTGTVNWADGDLAAKTISIPLVDDGATEGSETFTITLSAPTGGATLGAPATATVTVADPELFPLKCQMPAGWVVPAGATSGWSVATDQVYEGTCSLKSNAIGDGQAAEIAYTGSFGAGTLHFRRRTSSETGWDFFRFFIDGVEQVSARASGATSWTSPAAEFSFPVTAGNHTIRFRYDKDANCCVGGSDAAWIDAYSFVADVVLPTISIDDVTVTEGNAGTTPATFTLSLAPASGSTVTVSAATANGTATAGADYTAFGATTVTFAPGETSKSVTVQVLGDVVDESNETFAVNLTSPANAMIADSQGVGTITDDDASSISLADVTVTEGDGGSVNAQFTVTLSPLSASTVTVDYATANGTATAGVDYTALATDTLTFNPGETFKIVTVQVLGDTVDEANETYLLNLTNAVNATIADSQGVGTITDDDAASLSIGDVTVTEGNGGSTPATFTVTLAPSSASTVTVSVATANGTATAGADFTELGATTLTFSPGETSKTVDVQVLGDTVDEADETFAVNLTLPVNATVSDSQGLGTITDDDTSSISIGDASVTEGNSGTKNATMTVSLSAANAADLSVQYTTSDETATAGSDYTAATGTLTFTAGETSKTLSVVVFGDTALEADETFKVNLSNASLGTLGDAQGTVTIVDDDASPFVRGDINGDGSVTAADLFYLVTYLFAGGPPPVGSADVNGDGVVNGVDVYYLANFLFAGGAAPVP